MGILKDKVTFGLNYITLGFVDFVLIPSSEESIIFLLNFVIEMIDIKNGSWWRTMQVKIQKIRLN